MNALIPAAATVVSLWVLACAARDRDVAWQVVFAVLAVWNLYTLATL